LLVAVIQIIPFIKTGICELLNLRNASVGDAIPETSSGSEETT